MKKFILSIFLSALLFTHIQAGNTELETIGALGGSSIYLSYIGIGTISDGYEKKVYDAKMASGIIKEIIALANTSKGYLQKLIDEGVLTGTDIEFGKEMITCYSLLITEANSAITYFGSPTKANANLFQKHRKAAWDKLSKLLKIAG
jgi:hypothetical protein